MGLLRRKIVIYSNIVYKTKMAGKLKKNCDGASSNLEMHWWPMGVKYKVCKRIKYFTNSGT